tara:strand:+ start:44454 stop:45104 length:651 start_codon:yes stop_codon:yes gene_type:complete
MIDNTEKMYRSVNDYKVEMTISVSVPAFRMPKKKYKVFFKQPNKVKIKSRGFGILPRTGMFTSPIENFNNLTDIKINKGTVRLGENKIMMVGNVIVDSLAIEMPNDYAKLSFKPTVDVIIDTSNWVVTNVITKIDTLKIMEIQNEYKLVNEKFLLPVESKVEYFIKDSRFSKWLKKDIGLLFGNENKINGDMVRGLITVKYDNYQVNKGIKDSIFD